MDWINPDVMIYCCISRVDSGMEPVSKCLVTFPHTHLGSEDASHEQCAQHHSDLQENEIQRRAWVHDTRIGLLMPDMGVLHSCAAATCNCTVGSKMLLD
jgi:hypothetical protein